jgi:hypothetical protein
MSLTKPSPAAALRILMAGCALLAAHKLSAHCDTLDGPVVVDARSASQKGDVTPVLKWVEAAQVEETRAAFDEALKARSGPKSARDRAETRFFETLVRVHRGGEGEPFTGLTPAGSADPAFAAADKALNAGSVDDLSNEIAASVRDGLRQRFAEVLEKKKHADDSVDAGRAYVKAYVAYTHYIEAIHAITSGEFEKIENSHAAEGGHGSD